MPMDDLAPETTPAGPTPSENTNRLIALCLDAAGGRVEPGILGETLDACRLELGYAKEAFSLQVSEEPGLLEALPEAIEAVLDAFDQYGASLGEAGSWLRQPAPGILEASARSLEEAYAALHNALLAYEWAYLGHGDEPHPALNLVQKVMAALRQGLMDDDRFDEVLDRLWNHFTSGIEVFEKDPDPIRASRGAQACRQALAGIQDMDAWLEDHDFAVLEAAYERFREGCLLLVEQVQDGVGEALIQGPTPSPQVNWVIHAARAVLDGLPADLLTRAQAWFEPQLAESYFLFEQCATAALEGPARMAEQVPVAREGFDRLNRALPLLRLGTERTNLLPRAIEQLETGATLLHEAWVVFTEIEQGEGETPCPRCGAPNPATGRVCDACGATLLRALESLAPAPEPAATGTPAHVQRLLVACEEAGAGRMDLQEFASVLAWARQLLESARLGLARLPAEEDLGLEVGDAVRDLRAGMTGFQEALDELQEFVGDGHPYHLAVGTRMLVDACDRLATVHGRAA